MRTKKGLFGIGVVVVFCLVLIWQSALIQGKISTYEIRPEIRLPEYRTDAARAIDAYERLMDRYMTVTEKNFRTINVDLRGVSKRLESIDGKLGALSERMARIEKVLGIAARQIVVPKAVKPKPDGKDDKAGLYGDGESKDKVSGSYSL